MKNGFPSGWMFGRAVVWAVVGWCVGWSSLSVRADDLIRFDFHPTQGPVLKEILDATGLDYVPAENRNQWPMNGTIGLLREMGFEDNDLQRWMLSDRENERVILAVVANGQGEVLALAGNGPWLSNEGMRRLPALTALRIIRLDHNTPGRDHPMTREEFDGSGLVGIESVPLENVRIGHAFTDAGVVLLARVPTLRHVDFCHSAVTEVGLQAFANHPSLEEFIVASLGSPEVNQEVLCPLFATMPKLTHAGLVQNYFDYENGLQHLKPLSGQLQQIDLRGGVVLPEDLERLRQDHPNAEILEPDYANMHPFARTRLLRKMPEAAVLYLQEQSPE